MGRKRVQAIQETLRGRFRRPLAASPGASHPALDEPLVEEILDINREYRQKAAEGQLRKISPRRLSPAGKAWIPVLHTHRSDRQCTALYSNSALEHEMGMTHDWVVGYRDDHDGHGQWIVITAQFGPMRGRRIIRGREAECAACYTRGAMGLVPRASPVDEKAPEGPETKS
jgi:hypothetical protein